MPVQPARGMVDGFTDAIGLRQIAMPDGMPVSAPLDASGNAPIKKTAQKFR